MLAGLLSATLLLAAALFALLLAFLRISRNVGTLDLEDYARRTGCAYIPIASKVVGDLGEWSKPVRMRLSAGDHPMLVELELEPVVDAKR